MSIEALKWHTWSIRCIEMNEKTNDCKITGTLSENPMVRECQIYAKTLKDVVDANAITQQQYDDIMGSRISIANSICSLVFGENFDKISKAYLDFITKCTNIEKVEK